MPYALPPFRHGDNLSVPNESAALHHREDTIMPPLVYETVAWFRHYSWIPIPPLPGESDLGAAPDPLRSARGAPVAGAIVGGLAAIVLLVAAALGAGDFVAAAAGTLALVILTGGQAEQASAALAARHIHDSAPQALHHGVIAISLVALTRTGVLDALLPFGAWGAAFALAGACGFARAAAIGFTLLRPNGPETAEAATVNATPQWLAIAALAVVIVTVPPFFGLGAAVAGIAAAAGAVALVSAFLPRDPGSDREFLSVAALAAEIAFLIAILAFAES